MALGTAIILSGLPNEHFEAEFDPIINPASILKSNEPSHPTTKPEEKAVTSSSLVDIDLCNILESETSLLGASSTLLLAIQQITDDVKSEDNDTNKPDSMTKLKSDHQTNAFNPIMSEAATELESEINSVLELELSRETKPDVKPTFNSDLTSITSETITKPESEINSILKLKLLTENNSDTTSMPILASPPKTEPENTSEYEYLIDLESEVFTVFPSDPALESTSNRSGLIRDLMSEPVPQLHTELAKKLLKSVYKNTTKYFVDEDLNALFPMFELCQEAAAYYLECFDELERRFKPKVVTPASSSVFSSINKKILYQKRNLLDLASNLCGNEEWKFQYAILENGINSFFENRSQISRLGGAELPSHRIKRCRVGDCNYMEPVYW